MDVPSACVKQLAVQVECSALVTDRLAQDGLDRVVVRLLDGCDALLGVSPETR